jgi:hypothetical protein
MTKAAAGVITHEVYRRTSLLFWRHTTSSVKPLSRRCLRFPEDTSVWLHRVFTCVAGAPVCHLSQPLGHLAVLLCEFAVAGRVF